VPSRKEVADVVHEALLSRWPGRFRAEQLADHVALGEGGLDLDSIEIVELLLECEERLGYADGSGGSEELLEAGPISVGRAIDHISRPGRVRSPSR
jgi:hypothetical protein